MSVYSTAIQALSPSLYWTLDGVTGVTDQSGNSRNGTGAGGITIGSNSGSSIVGETTSTDFDGVDDIVTSTYTPFVNGRVTTFCGWALRDTSTAGNTFFGDTVNHPNAVAFYLAPGNNNIIFAPQSGFGSVTWTNAWPGNGLWTFWVLVFDELNDLASLYINGALISSLAMTTQWFATPGTFKVGAFFSTNANPFDGKMAHISVFESGLTGLQIANLYSKGVTSTQQLRRMLGVG
jgi:hypothetical protein